MKSFVISIVVFSLSIIFVIWANISINNFLSDVLDTLNSLPDDKNYMEEMSSDERERFIFSAKKLKSDFENSYPFLLLTENRNDADALYESVCEVCSYFENEDYQSYAASKSNAVSRTNSLIRSESFSFSNIF